MSTKPEQPLRVGEWCYLPAQDKLVKLDNQGDVIETAELDNLCQKAMNYLLANAGRLITRDELLNDVWGVRDVSDGRISRVIRVLRVTLGDDTKEPRYIETIPKRGFRFIAPIEVFEMKPFVGLDSQTPANESIEVDVNPETLRKVEADNQIVTPKVMFRRKSILNILGVVLISLVLTAVFTYYKNQEKQIPYKPFVPISKMSGAESHVAISSDGRFLVYVNSKKSSAGEQLVLQQRDGTERFILTSSKNELFSGPQFSADNRTIYFQSLARGNACSIRKVTLDRSMKSIESDSILTNCSPKNFRARLTISPDGNFLVFPNYQEDTKNVALVLYNFNSGKLERLTIAPPTSRGDISAFFAADSDRIAFVRDVAGSSGQIWVMSLTDRIPKLITYPQERYPAGLSWYDNDKSILFSGAKHTINAVEVESGTVSTLFVADSPSRDVLVHDDMLFAAAGGGWQIKQEKLLNPLLSQSHTPYPVEVLTDTATEENPVREMPSAVVTSRSNLQTVALIYPDGRQEKLAEFATDSFIGILEFSPDGKSLLVGYANQLWLYTLGEAPVQIHTSSEQLDNVSWGGSGKYVNYFISIKGRWQLFRFDLQTKKSSFVSSSYEFYQESPNGSYTVWCKTTEPDFYLENADGTLLKIPLKDSDTTAIRRFVSRENGFYYLKQRDTGYPVLYRFDRKTGTEQSTDIRIWGAGRLFSISADEMYILRDAGSRGEVDISFINLK